MNFDPKALAAAVAEGSAWVGAAEAGLRQGILYQFPEIIRFTLTGLGECRGYREPAKQPSAPKPTPQQAQADSPVPPAASPAEKAAPPVSTPAPVPASSNPPPAMPLDELVRVAQLKAADQARPPDLVQLLDEAGDKMVSVLSKSSGARHLPRYRGTPPS